MYQPGSESNVDPETIVPTYTAAQVRAAEQPLLEAGEALMARAAAALARVASEMLEEHRSSEPRSRPRVLVLVGAGNNGGDALFAGAHIAPRADVDVLLLSSRYQEEGLTAAHAAGARRTTLDEALSADPALVIDGILGIGVSEDPALRGNARDAVEALLPRVRAGRSRVIAVDLPSGLHPDTGAADRAVLPADTTVTFGAVKHGLAVGQGPDLAGSIVLVPIGLESQLTATPPLGTTQVSRILT